MLLAHLVTEPNLSILQMVNAVFGKTIEIDRHQTTIKGIFVFPPAHERHANNGAQTIL